MNPNNWPKVFTCPVCGVKSNALLHCVLPEGTPQQPKKKAQQEEDES